MRLLALTAADLREALPMRAAVESMKRAFGDLSTGRATVPQRATLEIDDDRDVFLVKPAVQPGRSFGAKLLSYFQSNEARGLPLIHALVVLFDPVTGEPAGLCEGGFLTAWRTGAASGAATDLLARPDASDLALFGAGVQARTQLLAVAAVRRLDRVRVFARRREPLEAFVRELDDQIEAEVSVARSPEDALRDADIVCTATTATDPLFDGELVSAGAHLNCVGSFKRSMREVDLDLIRRATLFVDSRGPAALESGELIHAREAGATQPDAWAELGEVVEGLHPGRESADEITLFKSVGVAIQDTAAGAEALERARQLGLGTELDLS